MDRVDIFERRRERFVKEGLTEEEAYDLATEMWNRDENNVDLRVCFECTNYQQDKSCKALSTSTHKMWPLRFMLQRCPQFNLKGKQ